MYNQIVLDHFQNPHNQGSISDADGVGQVGNPVCGDIMKIYLKIKSDESNNIDNYIIKDVKFETLGCGAAIASTSMLTDLVKGKKVSDALKITKQDVADALGGLPAPKVHCSVLAVDGLKKAVENYIKKYDKK
ncbi:iron-sulfur cluster assembly scaffold protein [Candidatus Parcubacteria bacterium]|nr:iron-sulfur cluster assembly scaffold protein [Candidatus Parcubacteria bacterium]